MRRVPIPARVPPPSGRRRPPPSPPRKLERRVQISRAFRDGIFYMPVMNADAPPSLPNDVRRWANFLGRYREPDAARSWLEIAVTTVPLIALWSLMWAAFQFDVRLCLVLSVPAAGFLVRLFMIQHDCSHGAFF